MPRTRAAVVAALLVLATGCTHSSDSSSADSPSPSGSTAAADPTQQYLDSVNALCDALLPKVVAATHGGRLEATATAYLRDLPAHQRALDDFDAALAKITVPPSASGKAQALTAYIAFADELDARRLTAANQGQTAWAKEIAAEADVEDDPAIRARNAAGFAPSCDAR